MDIIQQIMLVFLELVEKLRFLFDFVNSQFLPMPDSEDKKEKMN